MTFVSVVLTSACVSASLQLLMTLVDAHTHFDPPGWTLAGHLSRAHDAGVEASLLSPGVALTDPGQVRETNDIAASLVASAPAQVGVLATLPLPDIDAALIELARALDELELDGVILHTNYAGTYLGEPAFASLWQELDRRGATVLVHDTLPIGAPDMGLDDGALERGFDLARAVMSLLYSGTLRDRPRVQFQLASAGGPTIFLHDRIRAIAGIRADWEAKVMPDGPVAHLRRLNVDTSSVTTEEMARMTCGFVGPDRVLYGSDGAPHALDALLAALGDESATQTLRTNALRLYPSLATRLATSPRSEREN